MARAGDINGDGYADLAVGTPNGEAGRVTIYLGGASGISSARTLAAATAFYAEQIASAGDVNRDGYGDLAVGRAGAAHVHLGGPEGLSAAPTVFGYLDTAMRFGAQIEAAGDVNGGGFNDLYVGDSGWRRDGAPDPGHGFVYLGGSAGVTPLPVTTLVGPADSWYFGEPVAVRGDLNGDGYADLVVGTEYNNAAYVYLGRASGLSAAASTVLSGPAGSAQFGSSMANACDVNGDGYGDVIVADPAYAFDWETNGRAFVFHGSSGGPASIPATTLNATGPDSTMLPLVCAGDLNGDGYADAVTLASDTMILVYLGSASGLNPTPRVLAIPVGGLGLSGRFALRSHAPSASASAV